MVAIFTGAGTGFERGSGSVLGGSGLLGSASFGRSGEQVFLNAANGNLLINRQDEYLVGRGPDAGVGRTYNSLGNQSDDNGDNWLQSTDRRVFGLTGTLNSWGSTIKRRSGDGSEISYGWDGTSYVATDGAGSFDRLSYNGSSWTWTDGDSRVTESYAAYGSYWRITSQSDTSGNSLTYGYTGDKLTTLTTANGETLTYVWSGNHISEVISGDGTATVYNYDSYGRLSQVAVQLSAGGGSFYSTWYSYVGATDLISRIEQTDGSVLDIGYDGSNRVTSLAQTVAAGVTRTTTIAYGASYTDVTDPTGTVTRLEYADGNFAPQLDGWAWGGVDRQPATIDGRAATRYTVQTQGGWSGISTGLVAAAGETISFALTLQASGSATSQALGLHGNIDAWGPNDVSSARIVSGPGQLVQLAGGFWQVDGLSTTEGTRIEITRTFRQVQYVGAYFYADYPGGYRAGASLLAADPELLRSATATDPYLMDQANWSYYDTARQPVGTLAGSAAYQYTIQPNATWPAIYQSLNATRAGDTFTYTVTLQGSGDSTATSVGLYGNVTIWGDNSWASARIISGPGSISQETGGLFNITGLSTTTPTRIEIIRTYDRAETGGIYTYVDRPLGMRVGGSLVIAGPRLTQDIATERANQLTKITTAYGTAQAQVVQFGYNANGDLTSVTDPLGNVTSYTYDANGNQLTATDRLGNVVTRTYNAANQVLTETRTGSDKDSAAAAHITRYVYDSANRLRFTISAEGDVTEYRYEGYGLLWLTQEYRTKYDVSGLGASSAPVEAQMVSWTGGVEATEIMITDSRYDLRGNLSQKVRYGGAYGPGSPNLSGGYTHEYFAYDSAGRLLNSTVGGQNTQYYVYDGLNRLVSQTDVNGGTTSIVFNDAATQTVITLANGFVQTSTYNKAGELISFTESGDFVEGGTAQYGYDKNGRLRMTIDATGRKLYYLYDKLGRKVADIVENGDTTEYRYDANGRLVATVHYMLRTGAMAQVVDLNSNIDIASARPEPHGYDLWTWTVYDKEGRLIEAIEGDGSVTAYEYDASGRLVKTIGYANKLSAGQFDAFKATAPASTVLPASDVKDSVARIFYDKAGRKIGALDGEGYLTRTIYDGSGSKVQEIAYANITNAAYRASGTFQSLIDSAGTSANDRSTRYVYDGQGLLRFTIDALNHVTEYVYEDSSWLWSAFGPVRQTTRYAGAIGALSSYSYTSVKNAVAALANDPANRTSYAVYDSAARLAYSIDAGGAVIGYSYDTRGQMVRKVEYATLRPTASLPSKGDMDSWVASYPTANDRITRYYYSARGELRYTIDAEGYVTRTDYDAEGRVSATVRWDNAVSANDGWTIATVSGAVSGDSAITNSYYDAAGRLTLTTTNAGQSRRFYYYSTGLLAWDIVSEGGQDDSRTYYIHDAAGRKIAEYAACGTAEQAITTYTYNGLGDLIAVSDPNAHTTSFEYDRAGRMVRQANAYGSPTVFEYNAFGEVTRTINARGFSTYSYYDKAGRVVATRDAEDYVTETSYTTFGEVASIKQAYNKATNAAGAANWPGGYAAHALDAVTSFEYDKLGRLVKAIDAEGYYEQYTLDAFGQRVSVRNKLGGVTTNAFDRRGLLVSETLPMASVDNLGGTVSTTVTNKFGYDSRGNRVWMDEAYNLAEHRYTAYVYDKMDRLIEKRGDTVGYINQSNHIGVDYASVVERYRYDSRGNLIETINANGGRTLFYYDDLNRKVADITAVGTLSTYTYDAAGNMTASRTYGAPVSLPATGGGTPPAAPGGDYRQTSYTYDNVNRLLTTSVAGVRTGAWNGSSFVTTTAPITTIFEYDVVGNVVRATDGNGAATYSYYDRRGGKVAQVDQEGYVTRWTLDGEGNVTSERRYATQTSGATVSSQPGVPDAGADRITNFSYDRNGRRLTEQRLNVEAYGVDIYNGQLYGASSTATVSYSYNGLGQVTRKTEATGDYIDYSYDATGRLTQESRAPYKEYYNGDDPIRPTVRYYYNGVNNLTMTRQGAEDPNGGDRITRYIYGAGQRLLTMIDPSGAVFDHYYDLAGNIVRRNYTRQKSDGSSAYEGVLYTRDVLGRVTAQVAGSWNGSTWIKGDVQQTQYNAYGEVSQRGLNDGWQEKFYYDGAGRLYKTNSGDGVWRFFVYDGKGNQTAAIESEGSWIGSYELDGAISAVTNGFTAALGSLYVDGINVTVNAYDRRGQATSTILTQRQLSETGGLVNLTTARGYNAFGEAAWERDARGNQTNYAYNSMGRATMVQRPSVQVTTEYGYTYWTNPTDYYYYDLAGRAIGVQDANGNRTTRRLLAGTGYGGTEAMVSWEWHADGGIIKKGYDRFGDLRRVTDEVNRTTAMDYDAMGRLTQVTRPSGQAEYYAYDVLGQRIRHWNSHYGTANVERTDYDVQGRVVRQVAFGDDAQGVATTTSYVWSWQSTNGLGSFGGWYQTTTYANGRTSVQQEDMFGHVLYTADLGGHATNFNYDYAGRMIQRTGGETVNYNYLNTGLLGSTTSGYGSPVTAPSNLSETYQIKKTSYGYDASGNKLTEAYTVENGGWYDNGWYEYNYDYGYYDQYWVSNWQYSTSTTTYQNATAGYDALGRMTNWAESGNGTTPAASIAYSYDANGNIRRTYATYYVLDQSGNPWYQANQDYWYRHDAMNRVVTSKGQLSGGSIVRGTQGIDLGYNVAGERVRSTRNAMTEGLVSYMQYDPNAAGGWGDWVTVNAMVPYEAERREDYAYDADGRLSTVHLAESGYYDNSDGTLTVTAPPSTGGLKANYYYDGMGRLTHQIDWLGYGYSAAYDHVLTYNGRGQVESEVTVQLQGSDTITTYSSTDFGYGSNYALGAALSISTTTYKNGGYQNSATTTNSFAWFAGAVQSSTTYAQSGQAAQTSSFTYGASGQLLSVWVGDGRPHSISFTNDMNGQTIRRDEYDSNPNLGDPHEVWYRFNGKQMGYTGNNGTQNTDYQSSIINRVSLPGNGAFQNGANYGSAYADFDQSFSGLTSYSQGGAGGSYTVRTGDTLQSIAAQLWGDSALWYRLAEANGMAGAGGLVQGQTLTIPSGVLRSTNNAGTFNPYNPADILGDTSPTTPQPQKASRKSNKCGVFGQILLVVIAVAVTLVLKAPIGALLNGGAAAGAGSAAAIGGAALAGAAGSVASQAFGVATGIQDKFSFKGVALAAIGAGVGQGLGAINGLEKVAGSAMLGDVVRGVAGSAITQGIGIVTGLQPKFDWVGVAAAGVGAAIGGIFARDVLGVQNGQFAKTVGGYVGRTASSAAGAIANAAARSLINGSDFGDNIIAALPDVIGQAVGNLVADVVMGNGHGSGARAGSTKTEQPSAVEDGSEDGGNNIVVTGRLGVGSGYIDFFPEITALQMHYDMMAGGAKYAVARQKQRIVEALAIQDGGANPGGSGYAAIDMLDGKKNGAPSESGWLMTKSQVAESRTYYTQARAHGDIDERVYEAISAALDKNDVLLDQWNAAADAEVNKLMFVAVGAPTLLAAGAVATPLVAAYAGSFYVSGTAAGMIASGGAGFVTGGAFGVGFEFTKNRAFGLEDTAGGYTSAFVGGGLGGTGLRLVPTRFLASAWGQAANRGLVGAFSGFIGEGTGQLVTSGGNFSQIETNQLLLQGGIGMVAGAALPDVRLNGVTSGRNNSVAIYSGLQTRLISGSIGRFQVGYAANAGAANAVKGLYAQGAGAAVDGVIKRATSK